VTDAVLEEVSDWQNRALEPMYPIVFRDALWVKIRGAESRQVKNRAVYMALGVTPEGESEVLGLWIANNEGAKFWLSVMNNLRNRGVETGLAYHNISFARVNPRQARRFCEGAGQLAKMGALLQLKADEPKSETLHDVKQLSTARQALIKDRTAAKARLAATTHRLLSRQIKRRLSQIERDLSQIADLVDTIIASDAELRAKARRHRLCHSCPVYALLFFEDDHDKRDTGQGLAVDHRNVVFAHIDAVLVLITSEAAELIHASLKDQLAGHVRVFPLLIRRQMHARQDSAAINKARREVFDGLRIECREVGSRVGCCTLSRQVAQNTEAAHGCDLAHRILIARTSCICREASTIASNSCALSSLRHTGSRHRPVGLGHAATHLSGGPEETGAAQGLHPTSLLVSDVTFNPRFAQQIRPSLALAKNRGFSFRSR